MKKRSVGIIAYAAAYGKLVMVAGWHDEHVNGDEFETMVVIVEYGSREMDPETKRWRTVPEYYMLKVGDTGDVEVYQLTEDELMDELRYYRHYLLYIAPEYARRLK